MNKEAAALEKEAHASLAQGQLGEAYALFKKAGETYKEKARHKEAALCLASAASCWAMRSGEMTFHNSSLAYEEAAAEAARAGDLEYASLLYRQAAINYERDMEFLSFSDCFYRSREALRKFLTRSLITPRKIHHISAGGIRRGSPYGIVRRFVLGLALTLSAVIWGHGERPNRTLYAALSLIFLSAFLYTQLDLARGESVFRPDLKEAFYFSVVTFTTVGYGDITPVGVSRFIAIFEALCGIFIMPIFIVGLSRKYLRI